MHPSQVRATKPRADAFRPIFDHVQTVPLHQSVCIFFSQMTLGIIWPGKSENSWVRHPSKNAKGFRLLDSHYHLSH